MAYQGWRLKGLWIGWGKAAGAFKWEGWYLPSRNGVENPVNRPLDRPGSAYRDYRNAHKGGQRIRAVYSNINGLYEKRPDLPQF